MSSIVHDKNLFLKDDLSSKKSITLNNRSIIPVGRIGTYIIWCFISVLAVESTELCLANYHDEFSHDEVFYSEKNVLLPVVLLVAWEEKIDSENSDSSSTPGTFLDFDTQNKYLNGSHSSEFDRATFSTSIPRFAFFSPLLI